MSGFDIFKRNPGHWDVMANGERAFRIRGNAGEIIVFDERSNVERHTAIMFRSYHVALLFIADEILGDMAS